MQTATSYFEESDDVNDGHITSCAQILKNSLAGLEVIAKRRNSSGKQKRKLNSANQTQTNKLTKVSERSAIMYQRSRNKLKKVSERSVDHKKLCASLQQNETTETPNLFGNASDDSTALTRPLSICVMCARPFQSETHRAKHEADHDLMKYSCPCGYKFENFSLLYRHSAVRHKELLNDQYEKRRRLRPYFGGFIHREEKVRASRSKRNPNVGEFHYSDRYGAEKSPLLSDCHGNNNHTPTFSPDNLAQRTNHNSEISEPSIVPDSLVPEPGSFVTVPDQPIDDNSMLELNSVQADIEPVNSIQNCLPDLDYRARGNSPNRSDDNVCTAPRTRRNNRTTFLDPMASKVDKSCKTLVSTPLPNSSKNHQPCSSNDWKRSNYCRRPHSHEHF